MDEIAREGAERLLAQALNLEVEDYVNQNINEVDDKGHRLVVRNGKGQARNITTGAGTIFEWIKTWDNRQRLHSSLGYMSPIDYEKLTLAA